MVTYQNIMSQFYDTVVNRGESVASLGISFTLILLYEPAMNDIPLNKDQLKRGNASRFVIYTYM